jgi:hypothetical protein
MTECSMSCCQNDVHSFVASGMFVLPTALNLSWSPYLVSPVMASVENEILPAITPPDRPPRLFLS